MAPVTIELAGIVIFYQATYLLVGTPPVKIKNLEWEYVNFKIISSSL